MAPTLTPWQAFQELCVGLVVGAFVVAIFLPAIYRLVEGRWPWQEER